VESDRLHAYFERELAYLRHEGSRFATAYPEVASRLGLQENVLEACPDPHVERLIESFAFLSGRIRKKLDDDLPEVSETLLNILFPHLLRPIPSMGVAELKPRKDQGRFDTAVSVPRHATLVTQQVNGRVCRFMACYPVDVWPIRVDSVTLEHPPTRTGRFQNSGGRPEAALRVGLKTLNGVRFSDLATDRLRLYFGGEDRVANDLFDRFLNHLAGVELLVKPDGPAVLTLESDAVKPVGFERDENLLPFPTHVFPGYSYLLDYFLFPRKFLFVDVAGLESFGGTGASEELELVFHLRRSLEPGVELSPADIRLGCTPIVNLHHLRAEPINVDHRRYAYPIRPGHDRDRRCQVFSVNTVKVKRPGGAAITEIAPVYSYRILPGGASSDVFWNVNRAHEVDDVNGRTDISFVDHGSRPRPPERWEVFLDVTCTDGNDPASWPFGSDPECGDFTIDGKPEVMILCASRPTPAFPPPARRELNWKLLSHLSLNQLSIADQDGEGLKAILALYDFGRNPAARKMLDGICGVDTRRINRLVGRHLASGLEIQVDMEEAVYEMSGRALFLEVLDRFLGLYASINAFTQLVTRKVHRTDGQAGTILEEKKWHPRTGQVQLG